MGNETSKQSSRDEDSRIDGTVVQITKKKKLRGAHRDDIDKLFAKADACLEHFDISKEAEILGMRETLLNNATVLAQLDADILEEICNEEEMNEDIEAADNYQLSVRTKVIEIDGIVKKASEAQNGFNPVVYSSLRSSVTKPTISASISSATPLRSTIIAPPIIAPPTSSITQIWLTNGPLTSSTTKDSILSTTLTGQTIEASTSVGPLTEPTIEALALTPSSTEPTVEPSALSTTLTGATIETPTSQTNLTGPIIETRIIGSRRQPVIQCDNISWLGDENGYIVKEHDDDLQRDIVRLYNVCWLDISTTFKSIPSGTYRTVVRMDVDDGQWPSNDEGMTLSVQWEDCDGHHELKTVVFKEKWEIVKQSVRSQTKEVVDFGGGWGASNFAFPWFDLCVDNVRSASECDVKLRLCDCSDYWKHGMRWDYIEIIPI